MKQSYLAMKNTNSAKNRRLFPDLAWKDGYLHMPSNSRLTSGSPNSKIATAGEPSTKGAIFLDRDGVLVEDLGHLRQESQLRVLPGVADALRSLQPWFYLVVTTNQSGIARGFFTEEELLSIHSALVGQLSDVGVVIDALYYCPHLPDAAVPDFSRDCECRKPKPGMIAKAKSQWGFDLSKSYMIGDRPSDIEAGQRAGVKCILVGNAESSLSPESQVAENLGEAAAMVLAGRTTRSVNQ